MKKLVSAVFLVLAVLLGFSGCITPMSTMARTDGFNRQWRGFDLLEGSTGFLVVEQEIKIRVRVWGKKEDMPIKGAAGTYSHPEGIVDVLGKKMKDGRIVVPPAVFGHEASHALQYQGGRKFIDPDKMAEYER